MFVSSILLSPLLLVFSISFVCIYIITHRIGFVNSIFEIFYKLLPPNSDAVTKGYVDGNNKIVYGSYTGDGKHGKSNPKKLTFKSKPLLVFVQKSTNNTHYDFHLRMIQGCNWAVADRGNSSYTNIVSWSGNSVSWVNDSAETQFNEDGSIYYYVAFIQ